MNLFYHKNIRQRFNTTLKKHQQQQHLAKQQQLQQDKHSEMNRYNLYFLSIRTGIICKNIKIYGLGLMWFFSYTRGKMLVQKDGKL